MLRFHDDTPMVARVRGGVPPVADRSSRSSPPVSLPGLIACGVSLIVGLPLLLAGGDDGESTTVAAVEAAAEPTSTTEVASSLLGDVDVESMFGAGAQLLADDLVDVDPAGDAADAVDGAGLTAESDETAAAPLSAAPSSAPTTAAAPTSAAPTTAAPTTAAPATAAPTTAAPATAPPTTAAPTTTPPTSAPAESTTTVADTAPAQVAAPSTEDPAGPRPPSAEEWAALRACESGGDYAIVSRNGLYFGAYQFGVPTWDGTARSAGRPDLVGVLPSQASAADQDAMASVLWTQRGNQPWPHCGRYIPHNV